MPSASDTNTTGEVGRNVPVPRRCTQNRPTSSAAASRWCSIFSSCSSSTSVGGTSVMWVGIIAAVVSPTAAR